MKSKIFISAVSIIVFCFSSKAQTTLFDTIESSILLENRPLKVHLPKSFSKKNQKTYPLILTLDGESVFYSIVGNTELLTINDYIPESIVVGIDQNYMESNDKYARWNDCDINYDTGLPENKGVNFKKFISSELLPYLEKKYKIGQSKTICGHSFTANYINYFLLDERPVFNAYISISPYIPKALFKTVFNNLNSSKENIFYYLTTGENDLSGHKINILEANELVFSKIDNKQVRFVFDDFKQESHYSLISRSLPTALKKAFQKYAPIGDEEYEMILSDNNALDALREKYEDIRLVYGIDMPYREDDLNSISWIAEEREQWSLLREIGDLSISIYPKSPFGYYNLGLANEKSENYEKALEFYKKGYSQLGNEIVNKNDFYRDIERMKLKLKQN